jgi:hypothetical protein
MSIFSLFHTLLLLSRASYKEKGPEPQERQSPVVQIYCKLYGKTAIEQLWVTTRPHLKEDLE